MPQIENPNHLPLPEAAEAILQRTFADLQRVVVKAELGSGFSGSRVFLVQPISDMPELPAVVKIAPAATIEKEYRAYRKHIHDKLPGAAEIRSEPVLLPSHDWGGLRYHLVGSGIFEVESLIDFFYHASIKDTWHVLDKRLFARTKPLWLFNTPSPQFNLRASYDRLLPVNLLITPTPSSQETAPRLLTPAAPTVPSLRRGDRVRVEGFVVEEIDRNEKTLTLNLPLPGDGLAASCRLRFQPVESTSSYRMGDVVERLEGQIAATRYDLLQAQAARALGQETAAAPTLALPGDPAIGLPNPLLALPSILDESRDVRVAGIHGDLNLANVLVDPDARDVTLIDFGMARRDHVLHDLLRLETGVVTWFLPGVLSQAGLPAETVCRLYEQSHYAVHRAGHLTAPQELHPALRKTFVILAGIREMAREYLFDPYDWGEYYQGLTLYLLGALKFKNLDEMVQAPLPKQVAFWGAAMAQNLLREQPRYDDAAWQPFSAMLSDLTGQMLDQYEIGALIDQGSMGSVYRAHQARLQRDVAIKVMSPALAANAAFHHRFEREARSIARLRHPNILIVHDYGETEDGRPYLVTDYVEGGTLRDRLLAGNLGQEESIDIVAQIASALDYAHRQGVVHRDIKPNNILLTHDGCPLLSDFGLAKPVKSDRRLTHEGVILGTPDYMAPEQAQGTAIDGRADIYALGVVLFEMLTGRHPFSGETPISVIVKHISEPLPRPSEIDPSIPPWLDQVVARATAKSPDARYQHARDLAQALQAPSRQPIEKPPKPRLSRRQLVGIGGAIAALALLAGALGWLAGPSSPLRGIWASSRSAAAAFPTWEPLYDGELFPRNELTTMAIDPQDPNVLYAGTRQSGVYRSSNGGTSWEHFYSGPGNGSIRQLAIDPQDPQNLYAISIEGVFEHSTDGGETWQPWATHIITNSRAILLDPYDSNHVILLGRTRETYEIYETADKGEAWQVRGEFKSAADIALDPQNSSRIYVLGREESHYDWRLYRSNGAGGTWETIWKPSSEEAPDGQALAVGASVPPTLYLSDWERVYRSQNGGASWTPMTESKCYSLDANPYDPQMLYCWEGEVGLNLLVSRDGGASWDAGLPIDPFFPLSLTFAPDEQSIYVTGLHTGLLKSPDKGAMWHVVHPGPGSSWVELVADPRDAATLYGLERSGWNPFGLYRSRDEGSTWEQIPAPQGSRELAIDPADGTLYRFDKYGDEIYRSTDDGETWETLALPEEEISVLFIHPQHGHLYAICTDLTYISKDGGETWSEEPSHWPFGFRLYFDRPGETIYMPTSTGTQIAQSIDGGRHWRDCIEIADDVPYGSDRITDLAIDPADSHRVFVATEGIGVWVGTDDCWTWEARNEGLDTLFVNSIAIHPTEPDLVYAATNSGVYISQDGGQQWRLANEGLEGTTVVYDILVDADNIYLSTPLGIFVSR